MRKLWIINCENTVDIEGKQIPRLIAPGIFIPNSSNPIPFANAKSILGQEYPFAIYNMRAENGINFHLEAFAILAGTIQENGTLYLLCPNWDNLGTEIDFDSLRWNDGKAIATPNFWAYFKALVNKYGFYITPLFELRGAGEILQNKLTEKSLSHFGYTDCQISPTPSLLKRGTVLTEDQIHIFNNLPLSSECIHLITAPRGRGKSTLSGKLAEQFAQTQPVIITARAKAALPNFWKQIENQQNIAFFAPDRLIQAVENREISAKSWLFIDEAASLPLPILHTLCAYFEKVVLTTTTQNYEGTGRGFELKFPVMLNKPFKHWTLSQPLRWSENDPLEAFVTELLLLSEEKATLFSKEGKGEIYSLRSHYVPLLKQRSNAKRLWQKQLSKNISYSNKHLQEKIAFYHLLANAHYKTTPTDLRRLFDGENQQLFGIREHQQLIACCWAVNEGGLDDELAQAIWRGERRPKGNLVAQYLCFQGNLVEAATLHSVRISRIAVLPEKQGQGYGKRLVSDAILQISEQNAPLVDFVSVSFGMSDALLAFWRECGFRLVQISQQPEASSGLLSAMMIYPLSERGKAFAEFAENRFERDTRLQKNGENQPLDEWDWDNLWGFAYHKRTLSACTASLYRLHLQSPITFTLLSSHIRKANTNKQQLSELRNFLQKNLHFPQNSSVNF